MSPTSRRKFISAAGKAAVVTSLATLASNSVSAMPAKKLFVHHVYFWLKNSDNKADLQNLLKGLEKLSKVKTIKMFHIGKPAGTSRDVIDSSYNVSWLLLFNSRADQDSYQVDPIHLKFVDQCQHLWRKVIVYDSVDV